MTEVDETQTVTAPGFAWRTTEAVMALLERSVRARFTVHGLEHLNGRPTLFVVNHFTRFETFIVPYLLHRHTGRVVHTLAHESLFHGRFGQYLTALGAVSTRTPQKHRRIVSELATGRFDWVIFPEGAMIKSKLVVAGRQLRLSTPLRSGPPHTGAAVLAIKAQFVRRATLYAERRNDPTAQAALFERYGIRTPAELARDDVQVTPVNITYYPMRPRENLVSRVASFAGDLPPAMREELAVEGALLLSETDVDVTIGAPIPLAPYVDTLAALILRTPFAGDIGARGDRVAALQRTRVMRRFMRAIYAQTTVNLDHLVVTALRLTGGKGLNDAAGFAANALRRAICLAAWDLDARPDVRTHLALGGLQSLLARPDWPPYRATLDLAVREGAVREVGGCVYASLAQPGPEPNFHEVRLKGMLQVIGNEVAPLPAVERAVRDALALPDAVRRRRIVTRLLGHAEDLYRADYDACYDPAVSKDRSVGAPYLLEHRDATAGVVLSHGYLSAPEEVRTLAEHLHAKGFTVYAPRLAGHGTTPEDLARRSWSEWAEAYLHGVAVVRTLCPRVIFGGFSTGGLLALAAAGEAGEHLDGVFAINASLRLKDIRARVVGPAVLWNELLQRVGREGTTQFVAHRSEKPHINYSRNPIHGVRELSRLIDACTETLPAVRAPALIVQGTADPIVHPASARRICKRLGSPDTRLQWTDADRHGIIQPPGCGPVLELIARFVAECATGAALRAPAAQPAECPREIGPAPALLPGDEGVVA